jgi:hypothetical protein
MSETTGFFVADNKIPIVEKYTSIPSNNGLSYDAQKLIEFYIPPNVSYFNPKNSYFQFDLELSQPDGARNTRLCLDQTIGAQSLIDTIRIHSGDKTELLEEIRHYPVHVGVKYSYHSNNSLKQIRAMNEGVGLWTPDSRGTQGSTKNDNCNHKYSPYFKPVTESPATTVFTNSAGYVQCKLKLPLHTGLFQNDKVVPCGLLNGLFVTILTSEAKRCFRQLDSVTRLRSVKLNPVFASRNGSVGAPSNWTSGSATNTIYVSTANNNHSVENFPMVVGEEFGVCETLAPSTLSAFSASPVIKQIEMVGSGSNTHVKLTFNASVTLTSATIDVSAKSHSLYSTSVEGAATYEPTYKMSNVELVLNEVDMGAKAQADIMKDMREGKMMVYDFLSTQVYNQSQLKGDRVANIGIPANHQRAKSIISVPTDASVYSTKHSITGVDTYLVNDNSEDVLMHSNQSGLVGISDRITEYFWFYAGKNQPSRNVKTDKISSKKSVDAIALLETDKALFQADMPSLQMTEFNNNYVVSRALGLNKGVYDMRNKDCRLNVHFQDVANAPTKDKLWCNFVYHVRRINIRADSISVEV